MAAWVSAARAQTDTGTETVIVTGDAAHLIETAPSATAFGLPISLIDTPRAVTVISDTTISRYGIERGQRPHRDHPQRLYLELLRRGGSGKSARHPGGELFPRLAKPGRKTAAPMAPFSHRRRLAD